MAWASIPPCSSRPGYFYGKLGHPVRAFLWAAAGKAGFSPIEAASGSERTGGGTDAAWTPLSPRQQETAVPTHTRSPGFHRGLSIAIMQATSGADFSSIQTASGVLPVEAASGSERTGGAIGAAVAPPRSHP